MENPVRKKCWVGICAFIFEYPLFIHIISKIHFYSLFGCIKHKHVFFHSKWKPCISASVASFFCPDVFSWDAFCILNVRGDHFGHFCDDHPEKRRSGRVEWWGVIDLSTACRGALCPSPAPSTVRIYCRGSAEANTCCCPPHWASLPPYLHPCKDPPPKLAIGSDMRPYLSS